MNKNKPPTIRVRKHPQRDLHEARVLLNGKRLSFYGKTSEEAQNEAQEFLNSHSEAVQLQKVAAQPETFAIYLATELATLYAGSPANTRIQANWAIAILITHLGDYHTKELRLPHILTAWAEICRIYPRPQTQRTIRKYLHRALELACRYQLVMWNYAKELKLGKEKMTRRVASVDAWRKLWLHHRDHPLWGPKFFLQGVLGLRDEEANAITADHLLEDQLFVPGSKTASSERVIHLPPRIAEILRAYARDGRFLVRNRYGRRVTATQNRDLKKAYDLAGVEYAANHGLRHMFGAVEAGLGCPRSIRMAILGQSVDNTIGDLYVHPTPENVRDWLQKWADFLQLDDPECLPQAWGTAGVQPVSEVQKA